MIGRSALLFLLLATLVSAFAPQQNPQSQIVVQEFSQATFLGAGKDDWSDFETRDMTREEMLALNEENEKIMNAELAGMTLFSLVLTMPMIYLVWVGFFSETAGDFDL